MAILVLMMGIPGSGKSTWANKVLNPKMDSYISRDEIRYSLIKEDEEYFAKENEVLQIFIKKINDAIKNTKRYVYADATHLNPKSRLKLLKNLTNKPDCIYTAFLDIPLNIALQRNEMRTGRALVPKNAIYNMYKSIILPTKKEGIDVLFKINSEGLIFEKEDLV